MLIQMYSIAVSAVNIAVHQSLKFGMVGSEGLCPHSMETKHGPRGSSLLLVPRGCTF